MLDRVAVCRPNTPTAQEPRKAEAPQLRDECRSYRILANCRQCNALIQYRIQWFLTHHLFRRNTAGIPQIYHFGQEGLHNILIIDLLGPSLEDLFDMCGRKFHIKTVCMAARQMVRVASRFCFPSFLDPIDSRDLSKLVGLSRF